MNTHKRGVLHFVIFKEYGEKEYTGICYELSMVLMGSDKDKLKEELTVAAQNYVETVTERKLDKSLLNQKKKLPRKYRNIFRLFDVEKPKSDNALVDDLELDQAFVASSLVPVGV